MSEVLINCENVSKKFCRDLKKSLWYGTTDSVADLLGRQNASEATLRDGEFWANHDISFELKRGECLGLIGRNGAGKTTLLKVLNGLIKPDRGRLEVRGKVGALIALGAGFNPILTGRENVFVNGAILGFSKKQMGDRLDEIVEFAGLEDFIDAPVRSYSSGMQVRLGFAVAAFMRPDILLIDEVLAVGDMAFRNKCYRALMDIRGDAGLIFVSHSMPQVAKACSRGLLLKDGVVDYVGSVSDAILNYQLDQSESDCAVVMGDKKIQLDCKWKVPPTICEDQLCTATIQLDYRGPAADYDVSISISDTAGEIIAHRSNLASFTERCRRFISIDLPAFIAGHYRVTIILYDSDQQSNLAPAKWIQNALTFSSTNPLSSSGKLTFPMHAHAIGPE